MYILKYQINKPKNNTSVWRAKLKVIEQNQTMKEQKKKLDQLVEGKAKVEKKLNTTSSDLQSREKKSREDQQQLNTLRQSVAQLSEREREVREVYDYAKFAPQMENKGYCLLVECSWPSHYHDWCQ